MLLPDDALDRAPLPATCIRAIAFRLRLAASLYAVAAAACAGAVVAFSLIQLRFGPILAASAALTTTLVGAASWLRSRRVSWTAAAARAIERMRPECRNVVITAEELCRHPERARPWIRSRVLDHAARLVGGVHAAEVVPLAKPAIVVAAALGLVVATIAGLPQRAASGIRSVIQRDSRPAAVGFHVQILIIPPAYTRLRSQAFENPERVEALQGSHLTVTLRAAGNWRIRFVDAPMSYRTLEPDLRVGEYTLTTSGYIAFEPIDPNTLALRRLIPVVVMPDRLPTLRVEAPGKDLLMPDARSAVAVAASAIDDFGLQSIELRYTKASGSGEQFEFKEGTIPLEVDRENPRSWKARGNLALSTLGLEPGDALVYRVMARDTRPGDVGLATSDTFFIEIAGPGQVALEGFDLPPDRERYALSQQMIVLKIDRLRAKERTIARTTFEEEAQGIAAEQRAVRANFVFLMGGHVEDEEIEAEQSHEIQEGRLENTARKEIVAAIQHMGRSERELVAFNTIAALHAARAAVEALQRAFGRNRYILRTLPVRSRIDPSRRLTGDFSAASGWPREQRPAEIDRRAHAARALLARLLELAPAIESGTASPSALTTLAEEALAVDPAAEEWQGMSRQLIRMRDALAGSRIDPVAALNDAIATLAAAAQAGLLSARSDPLRGSLFSAWAEARRPR